MHKELEYPGSRGVQGAGVPRELRYTRSWDAQEAEVHKELGCISLLV